MVEPNAKDLQRESLVHAARPFLQEMCVLISAFDTPPRAVPKLTPMRCAVARANIRVGVVKSQLR